MASSEISEHLGSDAPIFIDYYSITEAGNWEDGRNVLYICGDDLCRKYIMSIEELQKIINESIDTLFKVREKRIPPELDNKILTGWNAMMISGYVDAYKAFGEEKHLAKAKSAAEFITDKIMERSGKLRRIGNSEKPTPAFLDDYAFLIRSFLDLYQVTFDHAWLVKVENLIDITVSDFFDPVSGLFFYTSVKDPALIDRKMELSDNVIPGSNSMMALNLFMYGQITGKEKWSALAITMLGKMNAAISGNPSFHSNWSILLVNILIPPYEIAIVGSNCLPLLWEFNKSYLPHVLYYGGINESGNEMLKGKEVAGKTLIYICRVHICSEPFDSVEKALQYLQVEMEHGQNGK